MTRALVVGGFEASGHDSLEQSLVEYATELKVDVETFRWRDIVAIDDHPIFHLHRIGQQQELPTLSLLLEAEWIDRALHLDLGFELPDLSAYTTILSVHPWSSSIVGSELVRTRNRSTTLVDVTGDFAPFPRSSHKRIDLYCGAGPARPMSLRDVGRCLTTGVPVRRSFECHSEADKQDWVLVNAGRDGWSLRTALEQLPSLVKKVKPSRIYIAGTKSSTRLSGLGEAELHHIVSDDLSSLMQQCRWVLTKASGPPVAEALASRAIPIVYPSGIHWEDDNADRLVAREVCSSIDNLSADDLKFEDRRARVAARKQTLRAAMNIWAASDRTTVSEMSDQIPHFDLSALSGGESILPETSRLLQVALRDWLS